MSLATYTTGTPDAPIEWVQRKDYDALDAAATALGNHVQYLEARIRALEAENVCAKSRYEKCESVNDALVDRIAQLEACLLAYWHAETWYEIGAADATASKLLPADRRR